MLFSGVSALNWGILAIGLMRRNVANEEDGSEDGSDEKGASRFHKGQEISRTERR